MIAYLKGQVKAKGSKDIILLVGAIGYRVYVPEYLQLQVKVGETQELYTHLTVSSRDDTQELYGLPTHEEMYFFEKLISISGVGPRSALAVLSVAKLNDLRKTIARNDPSLLQKVAGIGKKTAERIVIELKDKLEDFDMGSGSDSELIGALENLGYSGADIRHILSQIPDDVEDSSEQLKIALKILGK